MLLLLLNNLSDFNFLAWKALQKRKRLRFNLEVRSCNKKLKFFKKYSPEKKLDFDFDYFLISKQAGRIIAIIKQ